MDNAAFVLVTLALAALVMAGWSFVDVATQSGPSAREVWLPYWLVGACGFLALTALWLILPHNCFTVAWGIFFAVLSPGCLAQALRYRKLYYDAQTGRRTLAGLRKATLSLYIVAGILVVWAVALLLPR